MSTSLPIISETAGQPQKAGGRLNVEQAVRERYSTASRAAEAELCSPVEYDRRYLKVLPAELIERDYGCGNPSQYVGPGEAVLDLGSGGGKTCYVISQIVGPAGRVIGVDVNDDMLALSRKYQSQIGEAIGHHNTHFHKGRIQDLALDLERFEAYLADHPVTSHDDWLAAEAHADHLRDTSPMIAADSLDVIVSNCVLNLVDPRHRRQLFAEIFRVLKRGGRAVVSDIVCDEPVPEALRNDPRLWSGCISGAFVERELLEAFSEAGFYGMEIVARQEEPWAMVRGIEFRSVTVRAYKGKDGPCMDRHQAVIYQGPWKSVADDDGHTLLRGVPMAVCEKTFDIYGRAPYQQHLVPVQPHHTVPPEEARPFDCRPDAVRDPRQIKGPNYDKTQFGDENCCGPGSC